MRKASLSPIHRGMFICLSTKKKFCNRRGKISLKRLADNVILRREPKNLDLSSRSGGIQDDNYSLRGACPELAEGLRMTLPGIR